MRYNHAFTIAYEVVTDDPTGASVEERLAGLMTRLATLLADRRELEDAVMCEAPFDTYEMED